jgi:hypothetical protein
MSFSSVMSVEVARPDAVMNIEARRRAERLDEYDP